MSAFAAIYDRAGTPIDFGELERVMQPLRHRGPDGYDVSMADCVALGHWHFWITPEELNERQPLELTGLPFKIVFDGRLDNRADLLDSLHIAHGEDLSDATLVLHAYDQWGTHCIERFVGEFAFVIFDSFQKRLFCARDPLGDRTLFYMLLGTRTVIASEPYAVAQVRGQPAEMNERTVAYYLSLRFGENGESFLKEVIELLPAHAMVVNANGKHLWRYWQPNISAQRKRKTDEEYAEEFRSLLEQSIRCRLRAIKPVGVLMSGGLDSTSVAGLAARMGPPEQITTFSYVFDELPDCDEREYIQALQNSAKVHSIQIPADTDWPYKDWQNWPQNPNSPEGNIYRLVKERAYQRVQQEGIHVLLTGGFGDHLYVPGQDWFAELLLNGEFGRLRQEIALLLQTAGLARTLRLVNPRRTTRRLLDSVPAGGRIHRPRHKPEWLTPFAAQYLSDPREDNPVLKKYAGLLGNMPAMSCTQEIFYASRYGLELRHPYRDIRLIEFVLSLPAYQFYSYGLYKHILRVAMREILPEKIRLRKQPTYLHSLFRRGIERERSILAKALDDPSAPWRKFIREEWLLRKRKVLLGMEPTGREAFIFWLCMAYQSWYKCLESESLIWKE